jgi:hypothetical protein
MISVIFNSEDILLLIYLFIVVLGFEFRAYNLEPQHQPFFVIGSHKLFAQAGFEP